MNLPVDPRKAKQFAEWVVSRDDKMDDWQSLIRGDTSFGVITIGDPRSAAESAAHYAGRGWVGLYCEVPEKRKSKRVTREAVRITGDGV